MLQTPHHFFSPDPFERNLGTFKRVPNEGNLFYGLIQDGNDLWNSALFCGSCAVLRRGPLEEVGGIAVETVTEDAHTALKMHRRGYTTAYLREVLAGGLATESLSSHIGQRIRWARGMAQIFRLDNPFLGKGLNFFQRLCYSNAMLHFFSGIPRLVFLTAPLAYLFFEFHIINASAVGLEVWAAVPFRTCPGRSNSGIKQAFVTDTCSTADCTPWTACVDSISTQTGTTPCSHCA
ncbi:cellulose synthase/poly-beta-1,6-N-acetylglucosamine synthase-like glycosyltransferase [Povalibacter uvarum]|uniref:Cellulose synthase/poly-beta-1,6-N-acetylglucosamine synthase-like glycosyltransferase n=1 Tax=Povalibacter uvarum TaxID=732238 RepID=A0A841HIK4_9GAMM|nr:glycosyltransferase family 2 protein [Povalibacter uvarum]MBB6092543.1 cellulose synthase/poly-beta-1,6-N-acetylglucosamine synthase-like glycosyltransferase [Povalibacter uvarum]